MTAHSSASAPAARRALSHTRRLVLGAITVVAFALAIYFLFRALQTPTGIQPLEAAAPAETPPANPPVAPPGPVNRRSAG